MLLGLVVTATWIPGDEHNANGAVKTLEDWEVGRGDNNFEKARLARMIVPIWKTIAGVWDRFHLLLDKITEGDLAERRQQEAEVLEEMRELESDLVMGTCINGNGAA